MGREVPLREVLSVLEPLSYPTDREHAASELGGVTLRLSRGEEDLGDVVGMVGQDRFESASALRDEIYSYLPVEEADPDPDAVSGDD